MNISSIEKLLAYRYSNPELALTALTHPSYTAEHGGAHYQRLEYLGDAVLELVISDVLYHELPKMDEGHLTRIRQHLVREETLYAVAQTLDIAPYVRMSPGEARTGGREKPSILSDVVEALIASVYLDGGFDAASEFVRRIMAPYLRPEVLADHLDDKSKLQEKLQQLSRMPVYTLEAAEGPDHMPTFTYSVSDGETLLGRGSGHSKQAAQQSAAKDALIKLST